MSAVGSFVGRLLLASLFLLSGSMKIAQHNPKQDGGPVVAYMAPKMDNALEFIGAHTGHKLPIQREHYPSLVLLAASLELLGATLFVLNIKFGAVLLVSFLVPVTLVLHDFWNAVEGTAAQQVEFINFAKNVCLLGAFIMYINQPAQRTAQKQKVM